jgi:2-amino-4-hydroxy-6-hydroxymethyldihydropteridine diphosphokinase
MAKVFLGIGSNLGDRMTNIVRALKMLSENDEIKLEALSSLFETEPVDYVDQPFFINCVAKISTSYNPPSLLKALKSIEKNMGRAPDSHLMPRPIDLDILLFDNLFLNSQELIIPHPKLKSRRFVLEPLIEIAPDIIDPVVSAPLSAYLVIVSDQKLLRIPDSKEVADARRRLA